MDDEACKNASSLCRPYAEVSSKFSDSAMLTGVQYHPNRPKSSSNALLLFEKRTMVDSMTLLLI